MSNNKNIFLSWLEKKNIPPGELDHTLAATNKLKFNNHESDADDRSFLSVEKLDSSFKKVMKSSS